MKPAYRKALFIGAILIFSVAAPLLILVASGVRYDLSGRGLVQTGTLILKSSPAGARVFLDRREREGKTPLAIHGLLPGRYTVQIEAEGFHPWRKEMEVRESRVTVGEPIPLVPRRLWIFEPLSDRVRLFAPSPEVLYVIDFLSGKRIPPFKITPGSVADPPEKRGEASERRGEDRS